MPTSTRSISPVARRAKANVQFRLVPFHRNVPDEQLIADLQRVAQHLAVQTFTQAVYRPYGEFNPLTYTSRFGSWNDALIRAGLHPSRHFRVDALTVLDDIRLVAGKLNTNHLLLEQYEAGGQYSMTLVYHHFQSWQGALDAAGLAPSTYHPRTTDQNLLDNLEQLWRRLGRQPRCTELVAPLSRFGLTPYQRRFGGYQNAVKAFIDYKAQHPRSKTTKFNPPALPAAALVHHKTTRSISLRLRFKIMRKDHFRCRACGRSPANDPHIKLEVDHIHPWCQGGETVLANLQTLCKACNRGKSDLAWTGDPPL